MGAAQTFKGWKKGLALGGFALVVLLALMLIGLVVGRRSEPVSRGTVIEEKGTAGYQNTGERKDPAEPGDTSGETTSGKASGVKTSLQQLPEVESKVMKTGTVSVDIEKGSYDEKYSRVQAIAHDAGGMISDSRSSSSDGSITGGTVTLRVPSDSFAKVMESLRGLGKVTALTEQAQDVTEEYVDLESRIRNLRAQESVYIALMGKAATIEEAVSVQRELSVVQGQIEELTGRRNYLDNHISYSTIQVTLTEPGAGAIGAPGEGWGFVRALKDALHGVVDGLNAVIVFAGDAIVYVAILALAAAGAFYLIRKRLREKPAA